MFRFLIDARNEDEKKSIITQAFIYSFSSLIITSLLFFLFSAFLKNTFCFEIWILSISALFLALANSISRGEGKILLYSVSNFTVSLLTIICNLVFILCLKWEFNALFYSSVIAYSIASLYVFGKMRVFKYIDYRKINVARMKEMLKYSLPLVPNTISWSIINVSDRIVITSFLGSSANGLYSVSYKFPNLINTFYGFFNIAWRESSAKMARDNNFVELRKIYRMTTALLFGATICLITGIRIVYPILVNKQYQEGILYVPILTLSVFYLSLAGFYGGIFTAYKDTKILGTTSFIAAGINILLDLILIKHIGVYAAAVSTLVSSYFLYVYRKIRVRKYADIGDRSNYLYLCCFVVCLFVFEMNNIYLTIVAFLIAIILSFVLNRKLVVDMKDYIKTKIYK